MARPLKETKINEDQIFQLAKIMCTDTEISDVAGVSVDTLQRRYAAVVEKGRNDGRASIRREQFKLAMSGNVPMLIWVGKQYLNQVERVHAALDVRTREPSVDTQGLSNNQLIELIMQRRDNAQISEAKSVSTDQQTQGGQGIIDGHTETSSRLITGRDRSVESEEAS